MAMAMAMADLGLALRLIDSGVHVMTVATRGTGGQYMRISIVIPAHTGQRQARHRVQRAPRAQSTQSAPRAPLGAETHVRHVADARRAADDAEGL
jgi:hypothetical protein